MKQGTKEWHEWRHKGIGASDANIIMGVSKFMTKKQLWEQKVGPVPEEDKGNLITNKGHAIEAQFRPYFELTMGSDYPPVLSVHEKYPWMRASLDGYSKERNEVLEIKYVGEKDFQLVNKGEILPQYYPQLQHQLMVTGATCSWLYVITEKKDEDGKQIKGEYKTAFTKVLPDHEYMVKLSSELILFKKSIDEGNSPEPSSKDVVENGDKELRKLVTKYKKTYLLASKYSDQLSALKDDIFALVKNDKTVCNGAKITLSTSSDKKVFDHKTFQKDNEIDEKYFITKKGTTTKRITL